MSESRADTHTRTSPESEGRDGEEGKSAGDLKGREMRKVVVAAASSAHLTIPLTASSAPSSLLTIILMMMMTLLPSSLPSNRNWTRR